MCSDDANDSGLLPNQVLSFDDDKIRFISSGSHKLVEKITRVTELNQCMLATGYLTKNFPPLIRGRYAIRVVPVVDWRDGRILVTQFCKGYNCEHLMRTQDDSLRRRSLELIREILSAMRSVGFMWGDLCPRNIIVDNNSDVIWLLDFERKLVLLERPAGELEFSRHIRSYAWEEFSCFLYKAELEDFFSDILIEEINPGEPVMADTIISRRKRALLQHLFGGKDSYTRGEVLTMQTLMADVVRPFKINGIPFIPMEIIDRWTYKFGGARIYVELVLWLVNEKEDSRYGILDKLSKSI